MEPTAAMKMAMQSALNNEAVDKRCRKLLMDFALKMLERVYDPSCETKTLLRQCEQTLRLVRSEISAADESQED